LRPVRDLLDDLVAAPRFSEHDLDALAEHYKAEFGS